MIEASPLYIHSTQPATPFARCGALNKDGNIAICQVRRARLAWGTLLRQSSAHENRNGTEVKSLTDESVAEFCGAMDEVQQRIAVTPERSLADIAIKPHMHTRGLAVNYAEVITDEEAYAPEGDLRHERDLDHQAWRSSDGSSPACPEMLTQTCRRSKLPIRGKARTAPRP